MINIELIRRGVMCYAGKFLPHIVVLKLTMRGDSALCYVGTPQLEGFGVKVMPKSHGN